LKQIVNWTTKNIRRIVVSIIGFSVLIVGIIMLVTPGPAFVVIPIGLSILATEFVWARRIVDDVKQRIEKMKQKREKGR
jgi:uncharacterized protein (TIGR02611 family)